MNLFSKLTNNTKAVFFYFFLISTPLMMLTFDATNWSDDYQYTNLIQVKARMSSVFPLLFETTGGEADGGHYAPFYNLYNIFWTSISINPRFFHFTVFIFFVLTAFVIFLLVKKVTQDSFLALLSGTLFLTNYYIAFKALHWNCFHSHATNTFTGILSIYFIFCFFERNKLFHLFLSGFCLLVSILNYESGFIFYPILIVIIFYYRFHKKIDNKKFFIALIAFSLIVMIFPIGAYLQTKSFLPLGHRFHNSRFVQNYLYMGNELLVKSSGLTFLYDSVAFDRLKEDRDLKEVVKKIIRENDWSLFHQINKNKLWVLGVAVVLTILFFIFLIYFIARTSRGEMRLFVWLYLCAFFVFVFIFYRVDIANSIGIFSSILIANMLVHLFRSSSASLRGFGIAFAVLYFIATLGTIMNRFEGCYQRSFFGITSVAVKGPDKIYNKINEAIGRFSENGILLFTHDYSGYHHTGGFERIGDMIGTADLLCYNATVFYKDFIKTPLAEDLRHKPFSALMGYFVSHPMSREIVVSSLEEARNYLKTRKVDLDKIDAIYLTKDYQVVYLNKEK